MVNTGLTYIFQEGRLSTTAGTEIENNKNHRKFFNYKEIINTEGWRFITFFRQKKEREAGITNSILKHMLIESHTNEDNKGKIGANFPLEHEFGFCKTFKKIPKGLGFELQLKTSNEKQNIIDTTLGGNVVNVTINSIYLYIPSLVSSAEQQQMFNEATRENFTISFDAWVTD